MRPQRHMQAGVEIREIRSKDLVFTGGFLTSLGAYLPEKV